MLYYMGKLQCGLVILLFLEFFKVFYELCRNGDDVFWFVGDSFSIVCYFSVIINVFFCIYKCLGLDGKFYGFFRVWSLVYRSIQERLVFFFDKLIIFVGE